MTDSKGELYALDLSAVMWRKSSASGAEHECVEIAELPGGIAVRDSKKSAGAVLRFTAAEWAAFRDGLLAEEL